MEHKILKCGHAANGFLVKTDGTRIPSCVMCSCTEEATVQPSLQNRLAKCIFLGTPVSKRNNETHYPKMLTRNSFGEACCGSVVPSNNNLPFFEHKPNADYDEFYCGCHSWD